MLFRVLGMSATYGTPDQYFQKVHSKPQDHQPFIAARKELEEISRSAPISRPRSETRVK